VSLPSGQGDLYSRNKAVGAKLTRSVASRHVANSLITQLFDGDVLNVDGDRGNAAVGSVIRMSIVDETVGGEHKAVERLEVARVVSNLNAAVDIDDVIHTALHAFGIVVEGLFLAVSDDRIGKGDLQPTPGLSLLLPGLDLVGFYTLIGEQERFGEVVPRGVAAEVGHLRGVPACGVIVSVERRAEVGSALDDVTVGIQDGQAFGVEIEHRAPVGGGERRVNEVLAMGVYFEGLLAEHPWPAF